MAIQAGDLIHVANQVLVDRASTAGPGDLNIPTEVVKELGNYESVGVLRDIPDLTFSLESFDASAELEAMLTGADFEAAAAGAEFDLGKSRVVDVVSAFKRGRAAGEPFETAASVAIPYLTLESVSYRFGLRDRASQSASLKGDGIFYAPGSAYTEEVEGDGTDGQVITLAEPALPYNGDSVAGTRYALSVSIPATGQRLTPGVQYTETASGTDPGRTVDVTLVDAVSVGTFVRITYQSTTVRSFPQTLHAVASATRPAAVKGRDIEVKVGGVAVTDRWSGVQSVTVDWRVTLDRDEELGSAQLVGQDFDVPEVSGTVELKARNAEELLRRIRQISGVGENEVSGALQFVKLPVDIVLHSPADGTTLKTLHIPDANFTLPGYNGQVDTKLTVNFPFTSESGKLLVVKGDRTV